MSKIIVAEVVDGKVTAETRAPDQAAAEIKLARILADYPNAYIVENPGGIDDFWVADSVAKTVVNDQAQADADALASNWDRLRTDRNALLASSDWTQSPDSPLSDATKADWASYRQLLRDLPAVTTDPADPTWPKAPE